jgi:nitronate monooxygenase
MLDSLTIPIVQAPMSGGPSNPALAAAVGRAGGLGFLAAGYKTVDQLAGDVAELRSQDAGPFGVNVFSPPEAPGDPAAVAAYAEALAAEFAGSDAAPGEPRFDDDGYEAKLELLLDDPVSLVSFTFGCPSRETVAALHDAGSAVWVTVTEPVEAEQATAAGADALVVQGFEAGGHRGSFHDADGDGEVALLPLLALARARTDLPLVASGGIATGASVAAVLAAGAAAAQVGSAFMRCPEAGTAPAYREALAIGGRTGLTRAFSGRTARGIVNRFQAGHVGPAAYPEIHHVTVPLRAHARAAGDAETINLWAGQAHELAEEIPAGELVTRLAADAADALERAAHRVS